ncbi:MAG TPA: PAS domain S-box protein, partial [Verrucomicrobiae bacterium]
DEQGLVTLFNEAAEKALGYQAAEVVGQQTPAIWHDPAEVIMRATVLSAQLGTLLAPGFEVFVAKARRGIVDENEWTLIRKDGSRFPATLSVTALRDQAGRLAGFLGVLSDISKRKRAETESANYYKEISDLRMAMDQHDMVSITNAEGLITFANEKFCHASKYTMVEMLGQDHRMLNSGQHPREYFKEMWQTIKRGDVWKGEMRNRAKDGSYYWVNATIVPFIGMDGRPFQYVAIRTDITAAKHAQDNLRISEERFRQAFDGAPTGIALILPDGKFVKVNRALGRMLGYTEVELLDYKLEDLTFPEDLHRDEASRTELITGRVNAYQVEKRLRHQQGLVIFASLSFSLVRDRQGEPIYFIAQIENITEHKVQREKLAWLATFPHLNPNPLVEMSPDGDRIFYLNPAVQRMLPDLKSEGERHDYVQGIKPLIRELMTKPAQPLRREVTVGDHSFAQILTYVPEAGRIRIYGADITELKQAEERLRESEERFRLMIDAVRDYAMFMLDSRGHIATWNHGAEQLKGYTAAEIIGQHFSRFYPAEDVANGKPDRLLARALADGKVLDEGWRVRKDGTRFFANVLITAIRGPDGGHRGYAKVTRDITESRLAELALRASEQRIRLAAEAAGVAVWDWNMITGEVRWDERMYQMYGLSGGPDKVIRYEDWRERVVPEDLPEQERLLQLTAAQCSRGQRQFRIRRATDGSVRYIQAAEVVVADATGQPSHMMGINLDVTDQKLNEQQLANSLSEKEALLREIHHRVKNNMQVISSILQLQAKYIHDPSALDVFKDCQGRIRTMA